MTDTKVPNSLISFGQIRLRLYWVICWALLCPSKIYVVLLAVQYPSDAHLANVKVAIFAVWTLPAFGTSVVIEIFLATLAARGKSKSGVRPVAEPFVIIDFFAVGV